MTLHPSPTSANALKIALACLAAAAAAGVGFAAWAQAAPGIFLATVEAGLSWCF